jgi:chemotaxis protein methyltransferase CheR
MRQPFDVIFCRNVVIYFDAVRKNELLRRFRDALAPGGYLVLGHSESLLQPIDGLESAGPTMYRRRGVP